MALRRALWDLSGSLKGPELSSVARSMPLTVQCTTNIAGRCFNGFQFTSLSTLMRQPWFPVSWTDNPQNRSYRATQLPMESAISTSGASAAEQSRQETLEEVQSRIFGTHIGNGLRSGRKVLRKKLLGEKIAAYYPEDILKSDPFMPDLQAER